jgi:hypothetical protein
MCRQKPFSALGSYNQAAHRINRANFAFHWPVRRRKKCARTTQRIARKKGSDEGFVGGAECCIKRADKFHEHFQSIKSL